MTTPSASSNALLTEHFGWTPLVGRCSREHEILLTVKKSLIDDVINAVNELLYLSVESVESFILSQTPEVLGFFSLPGTIPDTDGEGNVVFSQAEEDELQRGIHQLETLLETAVDRTFDGFELFVLRNILVVREDLVNWVQLAHYSGINFEVRKYLNPPEPIPVADIQTRLRSFRQKLLSSHKLNNALKFEISANERALSQLRAITNSASSPNITNETLPHSFLSVSKGTKDAAEFTASQVGLIRKMVEELKPKQTELHSQRVCSLTEARDSTDIGDERRKYIERMTRKYMEVSSGMRLNSRGEIVRGDFSAGGVRKDTIEVQRLEEIATKLGKN